MSTKLPSLDALIESFLVCCMTEGKSEKTIEFYAHNLSKFSRFTREQKMNLPVDQIGTAEARKFIFHLQNNAVRWEHSPNIKVHGRLSPFSIQANVRSIKAFWTWLFLEGYIPRNVMSALKLPKAPKKIVNTFSQEQIQTMLNNINHKSLKGMRDHLIILLLLDTGIRLSELVGLTIANIDFEQNCFQVRGKGDKDRMVPFGNGVRRVLWQYINESKSRLQFEESNQLFTTESGLPMKKRAVQTMISRLGKRSGIMGVRCSPHTFRHTFAKQYLMLGGDVFSLQRILGHSSLEIVRLYINLATSDIVEQHRRYSPIDNISYSKKGKRHFPNRLRHDNSAIEGNERLRFITTR
ncbi:tyrosine-type recombinase/integrase [Chloroflexota bacterium]